MASPSVVEGIGGVVMLLLGWLSRRKGVHRTVGPLQNVVLGQGVAAASAMSSGQPLDPSVMQRGVELMVVVEAAVNLGKWLLRLRRKKPQEGAVL